MTSKNAQENGNGINAKRTKLYNSKVTVVLGKCKIHLKYTYYTCFHSCARPSKIGNLRTNSQHSIDCVLLMAFSIFFLRW